MHKLCEIDEQCEIKAANIHVNASSVPRDEVADDWTKRGVGLQGSSGLL